MQRPIQITGITPFAQWQPGPHGPGPHGPHWGAGPTGGTGMGGAAGLGVGGWWLPLLFALLVVGLVAVALYLTTRADDAGDADGALATLRERYAAGDLDEAEFEHRRDRLTDRPG